MHVDYVKCEEQLFCILNELWVTKHTTVQI